MKHSKLTPEEQVIERERVQGLMENAEKYHLQQFVKSTSYFKHGSGWAGSTLVKPDDSKYWVYGDSIDDCKEKLLERYYYVEN